MYLNFSLILKFTMMVAPMIISKNTNPKIVMTTMLLTYNMSLQSPLATKISYFMTADLISFWITNMSIMLFYVLALTPQENKEAYKIMMSFMIITLIFTFNSWSFMMFYIMFETSLIIILLTIMTWGYQPERTEAMMFMIIMTIMLSLPLMITMMISKKNLNFWFTETTPNLMTFLSFMFIFMMKMPIYFTHFWLPKAHVEAPVHGSMILAAILLKLGCYGMIRMSAMTKKFKELKIIAIAISTISMIVLSMNCIMQIDIKTLIAYSSIVHMTMVFMNILLMKTKSIYSSLLIILGHGLCSAALFFMANTMYTNSKSRSIMLNKSNLTVMPPMTLMWFTATMNNAPMPPSMNMMGELMSFKNILSWTETLMVPIVVMALVSSMYSIYLFCPPSQGKYSKLTNKMKMVHTNNTITMIMMTAPLTTITIKPSMLAL